MRPMTDLEPVTEVRDMEESSVDAATNLKEQAERDEKEAGENRIEKRPRAHTLCLCLNRDGSTASVLEDQRSMTDRGQVELCRQCSVLTPDRELVLKVRWLLVTSVSSAEKKE
uniref:Uncharacterized protein n=1 Tax=Magallana gigas TaxID=29159 RepID=A0A8W8LM93_MAGGI